MTPTTAKTLHAEGKKDVQKLQRAIIDGLEDVKAQNIQVFDTEHITSLFERVIVASGTSNRQTKALAASVRDAVRDAGFGKPRIEGEDNGEWIIVDCGAAVAHIMQPLIRQYYNLEELWGDKPIKLKLGAPAPQAKPDKAEPEADVKPARPTRSGVAAGSRSKSVAKTSTLAKQAGVNTSSEAKKIARTDDGTYVGRVGKTNDWTAKRNASAPAAEPETKPARVRKPVMSTKPEAPKPVPKKAPARTPIVKIPAAKKSVARQLAVKTAAKASITRKPATKKSAPRSE